MTRVSHNVPCIFVAAIGWNHADDTITCLKSLSKSDYPGIVLAYVDNASTDGAPERIKSEIPDVQIIKNETNLGFPTAADIAIQHGYQSGADYTFVINNDTVVAPDMISRLIDHDDDSTGLLAPVIFYYSDPKVVWSIGGRMNSLTLEANHSLRGKVFDGSVSGYYDQDFVTGCALLIPRRTVSQVGGFDRSYFYYYDDMDYSLRVKKAGLKIKVVKDAHMWHKVAMSSGGKDGVDERYWMAYSSVLFYKKHAKYLHIPVIVVYRLLSGIKTSLRLLFKSKWDSLVAYWKGIHDGLLGRAQK
jgi:GT2 family glycosyltransferase